MIEPLGGFQQAPKSRMSRKWIYLLIGLVVLMPLVIGGFVLALLGGAFFLGVKATDEYECAIGTLRANPEAKRLLGEPIEPSLFAVGSFSLKGRDRTVTFTTTVTGPKGSGELSVVSVRDGFNSDFLMSIEVDGQRTAIHTGGYPCSQ